MQCRVFDHLVFECRQPKFSCFENLWPFFHKKLLFDQGLFSEQFFNRTSSVHPLLNIDGYKYTLCTRTIAVNHARFSFFIDLCSVSLSIIISTNYKLHSHKISMSSHFDQVSFDSDKFCGIYINIMFQAQFANFCDYPLALNSKYLSES